MILINIRLRVFILQNNVKIPKKNLHVLKTYLKSIQKYLSQNRVSGLSVTLPPPPESLPRRHPLMDSWRSRRFTVVTDISHMQGRQCRPYNWSSLSLSPLDPKSSLSTCPVPPHTSPSSHISSRRHPLMYLTSVRRHHRPHQIYTNKLLMVLGGWGKIPYDKVI